MNDRLKDLLGMKPEPPPAPSTAVTPAGAEPFAAELPEEEEGEALSGGAYAARRGMKDRAEDIEFRLLARDRPDLAAEYHLRRHTLWHKADGSIELVFVDGLRVRIRGLHLFELKERIRLRRVTWVQEQGSDPLRMKAAQQQLGAQFVWVEKIEITMPEDEEGD